MLVYYCIIFTVLVTKVHSSPTKRMWYNCDVSDDDCQHGTICTADTSYGINICQESQDGYVEPYRCMRTMNGPTHSPFNLAKKKKCRKSSDCCNPEAICNDDQQCVLPYVSMEPLPPMDAVCVIPSGIGEAVTDKITTATAAALVNGLPYAFIPMAPIIDSGLLQLEASIIFRQIFYLGVVCYAASAAYHETAIEPFGRQDVSLQRKRCQIYKADNAVLWNLHDQITSLYTFALFIVTFQPEKESEVAATFSAFGLDYYLIEDPSAADISTPWGLANAIMKEPVFVRLYSNDGWNADGRESNQYNRVPFKDFAYTDYTDEAYIPYATYNPKRKRRNCEVKEDQWLPIEETDQRGYVVRQEHVTPHIGFTGRLFGLNDEQYAGFSSPEPHYNYDEEVTKVVERSKKMATDDQQKMLIEFFDSKISSLLPLQIQYSLKKKLSLFEFWYLDLYLEAAMYNGILMTWRDKVSYNKVRPTTAVHDLLGGQTIDSYAGPYQGVKHMDARDWNAHTRVMPHAEYPSASACICTAWAEVMAAYNEDSDEIGFPLSVTFTNGSSLKEPGTVPAETFTTVYTRFSQVAIDCGESRLNGGMHFEAAVPAGKQLCSGVESIITGKMHLLKIGDSAGALADIHDNRIKVKYQKKYQERKDRA